LLAIVESEQDARTPKMHLITVENSIFEPFDRLGIIRESSLGIIKFMKGIYSPDTEGIALNKMPKTFSTSDK